MSDMWMPAQTTRPPLRTAFSAAGTSAPTGAKMIAQSSGSGGACVGAAGPAGAELAREMPVPATSPGRVNAKTSRPCQRATCAMM